MLKKGDILLEGPIVLRACGNKCVTMSGILITTYMDYRQRQMTPLSNEERIIAIDMRLSKIAEVAQRGFPGEMFIGEKLFLDCLKKRKVRLDLIPKLDTQIIRKWSKKELKEHFEFAAKVIPVLWEAVRL